jgi:putative glutamine amidotransferase
MRPLVLMPSDVKQVDSQPFHAVGEKYINAIKFSAQLQPLLVPAIGSDECDSHLDRLLDLANGLFLTGSVSNVSPSRYHSSDSPMDPDFQRDATVFPLISRAIERRIPILAICRGIQELNVACGGTLHTALHEQPGNLDHREPVGESKEIKYGPAHEVSIHPGGILASIIEERRFRVNSLHGQGIAELGANLNVEATAPDGVIEAISLPGHFVLGVQWHPEWAHEKSPQSTAIFRAFGRAVTQQTDEFG